MNNYKQALKKSQIENKKTLNTKNKKSNIEELSKIKTKKEKMEDFQKFMSVRKLTKSKIEKISCCGDFLKFLSNADRTVHTLAGGIFCNDRLCPICSWRLAKKTAFQLMELLAYAKEIEKKEFIFLTLTAPNVSAEKLIDEITEFNKSFKRLSETENFKSAIKGFIRKLEITYNSDKDTYHPHFHCILGVNKTYFRSKFYIKREKWLEMWKKAKRDESITQVDIRKVKMDCIKEIFEIATYATKHKDLFHSQEVFNVFYNAFKNRKIITYAGIFKDLRDLQNKNKLEIEEIQDLNDIKEIVDREIWYNYSKLKKEYVEKLEIFLEEIKQIYVSDKFDFE